VRVQGFRVWDWRLRVSGLRIHLETEEGGEVRRLGHVIAGELLALAARALGALLGEESQVTKAGVLELTVRHLREEIRGEGSGFLGRAV